MLHPFDIAVLVLYLSAVVVVGVRLSAGSKELDGYLLGGRMLPWWAILGSIVATETSTATFLSVPGIAYEANGGDFRFLQLALGYIVGRLIVVKILLPRYFEGRFLTAYQLLQQRFGRLTQTTASLLFLAARNLGDGLRLFLAALVLYQVLPVSLPMCILLVGSVTIVYTLLGGIKSVVWNDCIQFVIYISGAIIAVTLLINKLPNGWETLQAYATEHNKFRMFEFAWDPTSTYNFWAGLIGGAFLSLGTHGTDQMFVQRLLACRDKTQAGRALAVSGVVVFAQFALFLFVGVGLASYYHSFPPTISFVSNDEVFSRFIVEELPAGIGLIGLILAAVFAAAMSTLSSSLNASASAVVGDFLKPAIGDRWSDRRFVHACRWLTLMFGLLQIGIAIAGSYVSRSVVNEVLGIASITAGIMLGIFFLGIGTRRTNQFAGISGMVGGMAVLLAVRRYTEIAWPWYSVIGAVTTFVFGLCFALMVGSKKDNLDISEDSHGNENKQRPHD